MHENGQRRFDKRNQHLGFPEGVPIKRHVGMNEQAVVCLQPLEVRGCPRLVRGFRIAAKQEGSRSEGGYRSNRIRSRSGDTRRRGRGLRVLTWILCVIKKGK